MDNFNGIALFLKTIPLKYFGLSLFIFVCSFLILVLNRKNFIKILISFELMTLASIINYNLFASILNDKEAFAFIFMILAVAASEAAIGLAIFLIYFKNKNQTDIEKINSLRG
jgi:NADH-quinone oxidoreductase subunit K